MAKTKVTKSRTKKSGNSKGTARRKKKQEFDLKVNDFTLPQIEYYRAFCNFDEKEAALFELRRQNIPLAQCAEILHYEDIKKLSQRVNNKVLKMTNAKRMDEWIENVYWKNIMQNQ